MQHAILYKLLKFTITTLVVNYQIPNKLKSTMFQIYASLNKLYNLDQIQSVPHLAAPVAL